MTRALVALVLGVLLGVGATLWLAPSSIPDRQLDAWLPPDPTTAPALNSVAPSVAREATRDFYRQLADADAAELAALIREAAARAPSTDRTLALGVLFKRYAELDAVRAVRLAREVRAGGAALGVVYGAWARAAPDQVLAALSTVTSPDDAADVALALIVALGADAAAVRRVAAVLVARGEDLPAGGALPTFAPVVSPAGPMGLTAARSALALTAQRWADLDARRVLAVARELDDERVQLAFEQAALRALARTAPDEAFAYLKDLDTASLQRAALGGTLGELARADPERLLSAVRDLPSDARRIPEMAALQQLAQRDPLAAMRHLERSPFGAERQMLLQVIARSYGQRDVAAALAWAREQRGEPMLVPAVIAGVAEGDPDRALDLAMGLASPNERMRAVQMAAMTAARNDATAEAMANRLLAADDPQVRDMVAFTVVSMWASRSPDGAMQWLLANGRNAPANAFQQIGQQLAMRDAPRAVAYTAQIPESARESWVQGAAQGYAQSDPRGAVDWIARFRGEEWYARAAGTVATTVAQRDGAAAARLFDELDATAGSAQASRLAHVIATNWASQDPSAAAQWMLDRAPDQERDMAMRSVVGMWSSQDADAARQWTLQLPQGAVRDTALTAVLTTSAMQRSGSLDTGVLNAFASPQTQQAAVLQIVQQLAYADPVRARAIADAHLEPGSRAQVERMIEAARNQGRASNVGITQGMVAPAGVVAPPVMAPALRAR